MINLQGIITQLSPAPHTQLFNPAFSWRGHKLTTWFLINACSKSLFFTA